MEFYDGDLKDIWDSDLDPTDSLKISTDTEMHDWILERDFKDPTVILNDKLISDALLNGTLPIKSEHSYSINSDGDSLPASPRSLHTKMDDMEDECYPAISLKTATSNLRSIDTITIDPKCLLISSASSSSSSSSSLSLSSSSSTHSTTSSAASLGVGHCSPAIVTASVGATPSPLLSSQSTHSSTAQSSSTYTGGHFGASKSAHAGASTTFTLRSLEHGSCIATSPATLTLSKRSAGSFGSTLQQPHAKHAHLSSNQHHLHSNSQSNSVSTVSNQHQHPQQQHQQSSLNSAHTSNQPHQHSLPQQHHHQFGGTLIDGSVGGCSSPASSSMREGSTSPDICSDIEIDEACIKDEPMSPDSSCPPSPHAGARTSLNLSVANMAAYTHSDLVFEHKNGCLQLTPASQNLLKSQQLLLSASSGGSASATSNIIIPKFNIKTEISPGVAITKTAIVTHNTNAAAAAATNSTSATATTASTTVNGKTTYGVPLTPPSSLSSDDSEGNLSPEPLYSPLSPATVASLAGVEGLASSSASTSSSASSISSATGSGNNTTAAATGHGRRNVAGNCHGLGRSNTAGGNGGGHASGSSGATSGSTRQPIHTPLISTQPKGSTGTLILTEEEKRTLLAEGYPIPQKLPLTKAEEKSLKKIRRKIKNKISAQESRRKKKEYMDQLERKVEILVSENNEYKKRIDSLEDANASLLNQLHKLQAIVGKSKKHNS